MSPSSPHRGPCRGPHCDPHCDPPCGPRPPGLPRGGRRPAPPSALRSACLLLIALLLVAATPGATARAASTPPNPERHAVAAGSHVLAITGKAGLLGALGHRHSVLGEEVDGWVCHAPSRPAAARGQVTVPTASLVIDSAEGRRMADLGEGPGPEDVEEIQAKMLSAEYLSADAHPQIRFDLVSVDPQGDGPALLRGEFTVRGVTRALTAPASVERRQDGTVVVSGSFTVRQTAFGMEPESVAGVVRVADRVEVRYRLVLEPTGKPCGDGGSGG